MKGVVMEKKIEWGNVNEGWKQGRIYTPGAVGLQRRLQGDELEAASRIERRSRHLAN